MAGAIRGIDPRDNTYEYAHAAGRHFRQRATEATLPAARITRNAQGGRVSTIVVAARKAKTLTADQRFSLGLRALLRGDPRKVAALMPTMRVLTVPAGTFHRKTRAELGLKSTLGQMDWDNA